MMYRGLLSILAAIAIIGVEAGPISAEVTVGAGLEPAFALLTDYDQASGGTLLAPLDDADVQINWARGAVGGSQPTMFLARGGARINGGTIFVDPALVSASDAVVAALLAHEARHSVDLLESGRPLDRSACMDGEIRAHREQAGVWSYLVGPDGKGDAADGWESDLNSVLAAAQSGPEAIQTWIVERGLSRC